jgi:predicted nucleic acid-binding protein
VSAILLDTSAYSKLRLGRAAVIDRLVEASTIFVPVLVLGELAAGFRRGRRFNDNMVRLDEFLAEPDVHVVPIDRPIADLYGQLVASLRERGRPIPTNDIWIAACAMVHRAQLLTYDGDFEHVEDLDLSLLVDS